MSEISFSALQKEIWPMGTPLVPTGAEPELHHYALGGLELAIVKLELHTINAARGNNAMVNRVAETFPEYSVRLEYCEDDVDPT